MQNITTRGTFCICRSYWLGIRDEYRTLIGLEEVNVVDKSTDDDEEEDYE